MAALAIHPPVHLTLYPSEPIRTVETAADVVRHYAQQHPAATVGRVIFSLEHATNQEEADAAGEVFRAWARHEGLLVTPPEDT
jgi:hypothetical protein